MAETSELPEDIRALLDMGGDYLVAEPVDNDDGSQTVFIGDKVKPHHIPALNPALPNFVKQAETVVEPKSFTDYLIQFKSSTAICRASLGQNRIDAVLDYHGDARKDGRDSAVPGRGAHVLTLLCPWDADYKKWRELFDQGVAQTTLMEFLEDMIHTIADPVAGDLLEAIGNVELDRSSKFKSVRNLRNGTVQFVYAEDESNGSVTVKMPEVIRVVTPIFQGGPMTQLEVKLRYALVQGVLVFKLVLPGADKVEREAFRSIGEHVRAETATPVFYVA